MSDALDQLHASLVTLHGGKARLGLPPARAEQLIGLLGQGTGAVEAGRAVGLDRRLGVIAEGSEVADVPLALVALVRVGADVEDASRQLRAAGVYPLSLALSIVISAAVVVGFALPSLAAESTWGGGSLGGVALTVGLAVGLLMLLTATVWGRVRVPGLSAGWGQLEGYGFVQSVAALTGAGAPLVPAIRASGEWAGKGGRAAAAGLARSLEAGVPATDASPLLEPFEVALLSAAASNGTVPETASALAHQRRLALARVIPDTVTRIQACAVLLAGGAVASVGLALFGAYGRALVG